MHNRHGQNRNRALTNAHAKRSRIANAAERKARKPKIFWFSLRLFVTLKLRFEVTHAQENRKSFGFLFAYS